MERGKPYVGAKVWYDNTKRRFYKVTAVGNTVFNADRYDVRFNRYMGTATCLLIDFLAQGEVPFDTKQSTLKLIKKYLRDEV